MAGRRKGALRNVLSGVLYYVANAIIGFASRKVFTIYLGQELLGLNGLVVSVISMLSLLEMGIAGSIGFSLYKPIADNDQGQIKAIMKLYAKLYRYIGIAVAAVGLILIPFLPYIIHSEIEQSYINVVYLLFLVDAVLSYFMAYRRTLLVSAQREYVVKNADTVLYIITGLLQIAIICIWKNYVASLAIKLGFTVLNNLILFLYAGKLFPCLNRKDLNEEIPQDVKKKIVENVRALFIIKIASYCVVGTDNILLSAFADLAAVAIYSNYVLIIGIVNNLFNKVFSYMIANVGDYLVSSETEDSYRLYENMYFMNYLITSFTTIAMLTLFNEFIGSVWLDSNYIFPLYMVAILMFNNYSRYITQSTEAFRAGAGLYAPRPYMNFITLLEGLINLVASVLLAYTLHLGIVGIFLGTSISTIITTIFVPLIVYHYLFHKSLWLYFKRYFLYLFCTVLTAAACVLAFSRIQTGYGIVNFILGGCLCILITAGFNFLVFGRSREWKYCIGLVKGKLVRP